jgi:hypothetical protein
MTHFGTLASSAAAKGLRSATATHRFLCPDFQCWLWQGLPQYLTSLHREQLFNEQAVSAQLSHPGNVIFFDIFVFLKVVSPKILYGGTGFYIAKITTFVLNKKNNNGVMGGDDESICEGNLLDAGRHGAD